MTKPHDHFWHYLVTVAWAVVISTFVSLYMCTDTFNSIESRVAALEGQVKR